MAVETLTPRASAVSIGHARAETKLLAGFHDGRMAHGWIFAGPRGIGKATVAYRFARMLLAGGSEMDVPPHHPVFRRIAAGSHPDLLVVEPLYDDKKEEAAREISVDQAREVAAFLAMTAGEGGWRVVIIDTVDAMNVNAANAILKILEEPPPRALLILISNNPGRLLPTIRSRCRMLTFAPLDGQAFQEVMRHIAPGILNEQLGALALLAEYSPGVALELYERGALTMYRELLAIVADLPTLSPAKIHAFAEQAFTRQVHTGWQVFSRVALALLARAALTGAGMEPALEEGIAAALAEGEPEVLRRLGALYPPAEWARRWQQANEQFSLAQRLHLDYKQLVIAFFHALSQKDGLELRSLVD